MLNGLQLWDSTRLKLSKMTKNLPIKERSQINDAVFKKGQAIMKSKALSLIYDKYGNQIYEKTSDLTNVFNLKKSGTDTIITKNDKKLIETQSKNDENNSDFIPYGSIEGVERDDVKYDAFTESHFKPQNEYLFIEQEKKQLKDDVFNEGINELNDYVKEGDLLVKDVILTDYNEEIYIGTKGSVYAYTWYYITIEHKIYEYESKETIEILKYPSLFYIFDSYTALFFLIIELITSILIALFNPQEENKIKFYPYNNIALYCNSEDLEKLQEAIYIYANENEYEMTCNLYFLNRENQSPTLSMEDERSFKVSTHQSVTVYGKIGAYDPDGDDVRFEIVTYAKNGTIDMDAKTGEYMYTPIGSYFGEDSFEYVAVDKYGNYSNSKVVSLTIEKRQTNIVYADMDGNPYHHAALTMTEKGIMSGNTIGESTYFMPDKSVSRIDFLIW